MNEELGRHRGQSGDIECILCGDECESVVHVLWECPGKRDGVPGSTKPQSQSLAGDLKDATVVEG